MDTTRYGEHVYLQKSEHKICAILLFLNRPIDYRFTPVLGAYKSILFAAALGFAACSLLIM